MFLVKLCCPNGKCARRLQVRVKSEASRAKLRCPACSTAFAVRLRQQKPPVPAEEEVGTYGLARESSLTYLLQREQDGFRLTDAEMDDKERLMDERLSADPDHCPACGEAMSRRQIVCPGCELNLKTGRRPRMRFEAAPAAATAAGVGIVISEETNVEVGELIVDIIAGILDADG